MKIPLALAILVAPAAAQSINVDIGTTFASPSNAYGAAAAQPGTWNQINPSGGVGSPNALVNISGAATAATVEFNKPGNGEFSFDNLLTSGDDEALLDDFHDVGSSATSKVKYIFRNLQAGTYDVYVYAWAPDFPFTYISNVEVILGSNGIQTCGGNDWTGAHVLGETYVTDSRTILAGELIQVRVTFNAGFATINGIQLVQTGGGCSSNASSYCTAGTSANGCQTFISAAGTSSSTASTGFVITGPSSEGSKSGLFYWGTVQKSPANMIGTSSSWNCVLPPVKRSGLLDSGGAINTCTGTFSLDLNARWTAQPAQKSPPGTTLFGQIWYRDPTNTSNQTTSRSDGLTWTVCP